MTMRHLFLLFSFFVPTFAFSATVSYEFDIDVTEISVGGTAVDALTIDGQVPAPVIRANVGDILRTTFNNHLDEYTSVHWHGILLPGEQDGVPYLNTVPIAPGGSHTFEFPILHTGTFWYHSHTELQIQRGLYGGIVLSDPQADSEIQEETIIFSDWTNEDAEAVMRNLKKSDDFYAWKKDSVQSWDQVLANGLPAIRNRLNSSITRMGPMDLTDVAYDAFLANGQVESNIETHEESEQQIKLRLINGATSSYFDIEYAGGPMTIVSADGMDVEPIQVQRLRISTAETYDVIVPLEAGSSYELRATSMDSTGYSSVFVGEGVRVSAPDIAPPNLFLMDHMSMDMEMGMNTRMDMTMNDAMPEDMPSAQAQAGGHQHGSNTAEPMHQDHQSSMMQESNIVEHMMDYEHLMAPDSTALPANQQWRNIELTLTGNMERYVWSFNGKTTREDPQVWIRKGENVRLHLSNDTMMHHPLHLHGHFFRVVNLHGERSPLKHTVNIPPMGHVIIEFDANEEEDWLFHCHNQYHMKSGMNRVVSYEETTNFTPEIGRLIQSSNRWFSINEFHLMSSFGDYEFTLADERHSFDLEIDTDLDDTYELHLLYNYHLNRFVSAFAGVESRQHHHDDNHDIAIAGLNVVLPFMIESEWRVDGHGDFRLQLEGDIELSKRFGFDWRWNSDNERRYGFNYRVNNRFSITVHTDTEYGDGIGVQFFY